MPVPGLASGLGRVWGNKRDRFELYEKLPVERALTMKRVLSGNQAAMVHSTGTSLSDSGSGTVRVSPVSITRILIFIALSVKAKYLPSGEMALLVTGFSAEFTVSSVNLGSRRSDGPGCSARHGPNKRAATEITGANIHAARDSSTPVHQDRCSCFSVTLPGLGPGDGVTSSASSRGEARTTRR